MSYNPRLSYPAASVVIDAERPARESVAVWAARLGYHLWGEPAHEGAQASTCPADPATPVDDAAIPVGDGTTPASIASVNGRG